MSEVSMHFRGIFDQPVRLSDAACGALQRVAWRHPGVEPSHWWVLSHRIRGKKWLVSCRPVVDVR